MTEQYRRAGENPVSNKLIRLMVAAAIVFLVDQAQAQSSAKVRKIGFLASPGTGPIPHSYEAFRQGLRELGYVEGENIAIVFRTAEGPTQLTEVARELVTLKVDVIVTPGMAVGPTKKATDTIPIVFSYSGDPIEAGFVRNLARPGGNLTGITWLAFELVGKRLEVLKEAVSKVSRVAVLANPAHPGEQRELAETQRIAQSLGMTLHYHQVKTSTDFEAEFAVIVKENAHALLVFPEGVTMSYRKPTAEFAAKYPHTLSGGQRQRVSIARAMILDPDYLVADEPVSMIDASSRAEILSLLAELQERNALTFLVITHDLASARHPYTQGLLRSLPRIDRPVAELAVLERDPAWRDEPVRRSPPVDEAVG